MAENGCLEERVFCRPTEGQVLHYPMVVVGGSTAAYAATLGALQAGVQVCLVQPQWVMGGQFTAQALSAPDDAPLMRPKRFIPSHEFDPNQIDNPEEFCLSRSQRRFREAQRQLQSVAGQVIQNPGGSWVSHFSVTPVISAIALNTGIEPYLETGQLTLIPLAEPIQVVLDLPVGQFRRVLGVVFRDTQREEQFTITGDIVIEATDLGDLLELGEIESRVGQESRTQTGEAILPDQPQPMCQQAFTVCAVVEKAKSGTALPIAAPLGYGVEPWLEPQSFPGTFWIKSQDQWRGHCFYDPFGIFRYRRLGRVGLDDQVREGDVSVINWGTSPVESNGPQGCGNDYLFGAVLTGVSRTERHRSLQKGRDRTQAYLHFLQTHIAPDLSPRGDLTWTQDGIALEPYIREARRGIALTTIRHEDVAQKFFPNSVRARTFEDSVGIGQYHYLDFHPNEAPGHVNLGEEGKRSLPFTIPLGALIPIETEGLILSAKSIGTTHITNAAYRMHPIEWAIGEAGGHLAAFALKEGTSVRNIATQTHLTRKFQGHLASFGIPLCWFNDISHEDPDFESIQVLASSGIIPTEQSTSLNFNPQGWVSRGMGVLALRNVLNTAGESLPPVQSPQPTFLDVSGEHFAYQSIEELVNQGVIDPEQGKEQGHRRFKPDHEMTREQLVALMDNVSDCDRSDIWADLEINGQALQKRELARVLYRLLKRRLGFVSQK